MGTTSHDENGVVGILEGPRVATAYSFLKTRHLRGWCCLKFEAIFKVLVSCKQGFWKCVQPHMARMVSLESWKAQRWSLRIHFLKHAIMLVVALNLRVSVLNYVFLVSECSRCGHNLE